MLVSQLHKYVFEIREQWTYLIRMHADLVEFNLQLRLRDLVVHERMDGTAEDGRRAHKRQLAGFPQRRRHIFRRDLESVRSWRSHVGDLTQGVGSSIGDQFPVVDVSKMRAALGFVHVVCGDEEGYALTGKIEEKVPEFATRYRIDTRSRL